MIIILEKRIRRAKLNGKVNISGLMLAIFRLFIFSSIILLVSGLAFDNMRKHWSLDCIYGSRRSNLEIMQVWDSRFCL